MSKRKVFSKKLLWLSRLLVVAAVAVLLFGVVIAYNQLQTNNETNIGATDKNQQHAPQGSEPDTKKPKKSAFDSYRVPPDAPRYIFISSISAKAMVKPLGVTADNRIEAPANIHDAGWYDQSAKPGQAGAMVIDGHIGWRTKPGIFYELNKLAPGDTIAIEKGNGQTLAYRVVVSQTYAADNVDMAAALAPINPDRPGLNLITCAGNVIHGNQYDKRLVVFAEQM